MATVEQQVLIEPGSSHDIDAVMRVMDAAFGDRFGEAWTRSQLGGILPMAGVSLMLAREPDGGDITGFSLYRTVADEAELLLIAVVPSHHREASVGCCSTISWTAHETMELRASISKSATATRRRLCTARLASRRSGAVGITTMRRMAAGSMQSRLHIIFS